MESNSTPESEIFKENRLGCVHYRRKAKLVCPCCDKIYVCRYCHNECEDHIVNRKQITEVVCAVCDTRQKVQRSCHNCCATFGQYICLVCNLFDDEDKKQFHCDQCGICRIGGADKFFHCPKCDMCLPLQLQLTHKCVENISKSNCPVCLEDIHTSRIPCHIPGCGHLLHRTCFEQLLKNGLFACPVCQTSLMNMEQIWKLWDAEIENTPMLEEFKNFYVEILCKDCHKKGVVKFHIIGSKCSSCGSYNTCRLRGPFGVAGYFRTSVRHCVRFINFVVSLTRQLFSPLKKLTFFNVGIRRHLENLRLDMMRREENTDDEDDRGQRRN